MKKTFLIIMLVFFVFIFSSCGPSESAVVGSDDTTAESTTVQEDTTNNIESNKETTEDKNTVDNTDSVKIENETEISTSTETETTATDKVQEETTEQKPKTDTVVIEDNEIIAPAYNLEIPEDFELKSDDEDPLLENKEGTIQFNIMDKTESATDFEEYVSDTYNSARVAGMAAGEIEDVTIAGVSMKRFSMVMKDDDGTELDAYAYLTQVNERVLLITLTSKDGGLSDASAADAFVAGIDFHN